VAGIMMKVWGRGGQCGMCEMMGNGMGATTIWAIMTETHACLRIVLFPPILGPVRMHVRSPFSPPPIIMSLGTKEVPGRGRMQGCLLFFSSRVDP
jgi:hypothetical protein